MKKFLCFIALIVLTVPAFSQEQAEQKWTYRASAAYYPSVPLVLLPFVAIGVGLSADTDAGETSKVDFPPYASIEGLYSFNQKWSAGMSLGYCGFVAKVFNADKTEKSSSAVTLIPVTAVGRCNYLSRPAVRLYGSLEAGVMLNISGEFQVIPAVQLNPIGVEFGRSFFGLVEAGVGFNYTGLRVGAGYRF